MSASFIDHPFLTAFLSDSELAEFFEAQADIAAMIRFEARLARAEAKTGVIPVEAADVIETACRSFTPDFTALNQSTAKDGVVVPGLIKALRAHVGEPHAGWVHFGGTSQDVIDTSLVLRLKDVIEVLERRLATLIETLDTLEHETGQTPIVGRTRLQRALPMTLGDRLRVWKFSLLRQSRRIEQLAPDLLNVQFGGAVGTLEKLGEAGPATRSELATLLGLGDPGLPWHGARDSLAEFAGWLSIVSGTIGKIGMDLGLMAQNEIAEFTVTSGGKSSAMPHKNNPIDAETLVTLAKFNATQISSMHTALVHEHERSGMAWTLEWMTLPQMVIATGKSIALCQQCLQNGVFSSGVMDPSQNSG